MLMILKALRNFINFIIALTDRFTINPNSISCPKLFVVYRSRTIHIPLTLVQYKTNIKSTKKKQTILKASKKKKKCLNC